MAGSVQGNSEAAKHFAVGAVAYHLVVVVAAAVDLEAHFASEIVVAVVVQYCSVALLCFVAGHFLQLETVAESPSGKQDSS